MRSQLSQGSKNFALRSEPIGALGRTCGSIAVPNFKMAERVEA